MPQLRQVHFSTFDELLDDTRRLHAAGYRRGGQWTLGQICEHLAYFIEGSVQGFSLRIPWFVRAIARRFFLPSMLKHGKMRPGLATPQRPLPEPAADESPAVERLRRAVEQFESHVGPYAPSPIFGRLTPDDWRRLHLIHAAHHLAFLEPVA